MSFLRNTFSGFDTWLFGAALVLSLVGIATGIGGQELVAYIEGLTWAIIDGLYDLAVLKDGRVFAGWDLYLAETGQLLVRGYDFITLRGNAILIVEGH